MRFLKKILRNLAFVSGVIKTLGVVCSSASENATDTLDKKIKKLIRKDMEQNAANARN